MSVRADGDAAIAKRAFILTAKQQMYQNYLDKSTPYTTYRWIATATVFILFGLRIVFAQGWYIGTSRA